MAAFGLLGFVLGCYTPGLPALGPDVTSVRVVVHDRVGLDLDAAAEVGIALRLAVSTSQDLTLGGDDVSTLLEVEIVQLATELAPQTDTARRAAEYLARIELRPRLVGPDGAIRAQLTSVWGEAPYLSVPGPIVALDGQRRRALRSAAEDAARRCLDALRAQLSLAARAS